MSDTITVKLVETNGQVDQEATKEAFESALTKLVSDRETEEASIATAVSALFDEHKGQRIAMPILAGLVAHRLNAPIETTRTVQERALNYLRANSRKGDDNSLFVVKLGAGGGVGRRSDLK